MAVANRAASLNSTEAGIAVLSKIQRQNKETASALIDMIKNSGPQKPGVGEHLNVYA